MVALANAVANGEVADAEISLVVSDHANAAGLARAQELALPSIVIEREGRSREEHDRAIVAALQERNVEIVCLAGYMRLVSPYFVAAYRNRILNIHPSLLPAFPGLEAQKQVLKYGVKWTGCTVHCVDETLDGGPIIAQEVVPVLDSDTEETVAARTLEMEHALYAKALSIVVGGKYEVVGRRVLIKN
jgi:phosphoribosylglycinamide formyltransferase-1